MIFLLPRHDTFMDQDMRAFWNSLAAPQTGDLRLYGGTALALYLVLPRKSTKLWILCDKS